MKRLKRPNIKNMRRHLRTWRKANSMSRNRLVELVGQCHPELDKTQVNELLDTTFDVMMVALANGYGVHISGRKYDIGTLRPRQAKCNHRFNPIPKDWNNERNMIPCVVSSKECMETLNKDSFLWEYEKEGYDE